MKPDIFFLIGTHLKVPISLEKKAKIMQLHRANSTIKYNEAISWLCPQEKEGRSEYSTESKLIPEGVVRRHMRKKKTSSVTPEYEEATNNLTQAKNLMIKLKSRRLGSERKIESFNIISNKTIDYFNIQNYKQAKSFKKINETLDFRRPFTKKNSTSGNDTIKYQYSGWGEHQFLSYFDKLSDKTRKL